MADLSNDYTVYMPDNGHPLSGLSPLRCGNILQVNDSIGGALTASFAIQYNTNKSVELGRYRQERLSEIQISAPEGVSAELRKMRNLDCMIGVQRRKYCSLGLERVHHYGWVTVDSFTVSPAATTGPGTSSEPILQSTPAVFGLYQEYTPDGPVLHTEVGWNPVDIAYCDTPTCSPCCAQNSCGCGRIIALFSDQANQRKLMRITVSDNRIIEAMDISFAQANGQETAIHCNEDELFIGQIQGDGLPNLVITDVADLDIITTKAEATVAPDISPTPQVTKIINSGFVMYATWTNGIRFGLDQSIDNGRTWTTVFNLTSTDLGEYVVDVAAAGSVVSIITSDNRMFINRSNGSSGFELATQSIIQANIPPVIVSALAMALPDFSKPDCPLIFMADSKSQIYISTDGNDWERVYSNESFCHEDTPASMGVSPDGFGVWFSRAMPSLGKVVTLKNVGRGGDCDWFVFEYSDSWCFDCGTGVNIIACDDFVAGGIFKIRVQLTPGADPINGEARLCFVDGTDMRVYVTQVDGDWHEVNSIEGEELDCISRGGLKALNCIVCFEYPCLGWHVSQMAVCPWDANSAAVITGASCPPEDPGTRQVIVKEFGIDGTPTGLMVCDTTECLPNNCD